MGELSDARRDLLESVAEEFLHNSWRGRRLVAVEGTSGGPASRFADDLAAVLAERGQPVVRRSTGDVDEAALRRETVEPFRAGTLPGAEDDETVLVVDGRRLLNRSVRGVWHFTVWTLGGDELPHDAVNVNVDVSDEAAPSRYFYDLCKLPPSIGERRADPVVPAVEPAAPTT
ncbi:hypothetical protein ACFPER_04010 [Agromyces aurantiacus]|uniref:Uridine kinase n=1 Tax=Agromyces aurantiacus TaxID=165814 RepID=A0ABV9R3W6_9MICO|nr:hypothetical protein [Agromyces aurantiacus]MBM7502620.1 hypothetical protein [Agromyces aurantiacus]